MQGITAEIYEIFASVQGEGLYCGQKQVFVRFCGCNMACGYCDEPAARVCGRAFTADDTLAAIKELAAQNSCEAVSFTGGEPLLQAHFIAALAPEIKKLGLKIHLETNGTLAGPMRLLADSVDVVAADIKLPSDCGRDFWQAHENFLNICADKAFVKIVLTKNLRLEEFEKAVQLLRSVSPDIKLFLQPATRREGNPAAEPPDEDTVERLRCLAAESLRDVRVLPQQHPLWGIK